MSGLAVFFLLFLKVFSNLLSYSSKGGFINVFVVSASGWERLSADDSGFLEFRPGKNESGEQNTNPPTDTSNPNLES